ncbi:hypothetical protein E2C01_031899 [Portunus trituberculatus]|uniref:Uncharacterized protein n=1 Tax=Portunus trituberculatus TaxID=210409 RepID=A0A5B7EZW1_PORTR|nr:hypothetical protein [Portunus trituberculatus]
MRFCSCDNNVSLSVVWRRGPSSNTDGRTPATHSHVQLGALVVIVPSTCFATWCKKTPLPDAQVLPSMVRGSRNSIRHPYYKALHQPRCLYPLFTCMAGVGALRLGARWSGQYSETLCSLTPRLFTKGTEMIC